MSDKTREQYLEMGFSHLQINELLKGQEAGIDISRYENPEFSWEQMEQIRLGLTEGVSIENYAFPEIPPDIMRKIRNNEKKESEDGKNQIKQKTLIKGVSSALMAAGIVFIVAILTGIVFMFKDRVLLSMQDLSLELKKEEITVDYQTQFQAADYIESYTKGTGVELILPEEVDTSVLGSQSVTYALTNGVKTVSRNLVINVVDNEPPVLKLKYSKVTLHDYDSFNGKIFIEHASDNCDGELTDSVVYGSLDKDLEKQKIHYSVSDSSGNVSEVDLLVVIDVNSTPEDTPAEEQIDETVDIQSEPAEDTLKEEPLPAEQQKQPVQQEYEETVTYEENGGTTTCTIHHYSNGTKTESCEWVGPWEEY